MTRFHLRPPPPPAAASSTAMPTRIAARRAAACSLSACALISPPKPLPPAMAMAMSARIRRLPTGSLSACALISPPEPSTARIRCSAVGIALSTRGLISPPKLVVSAVRSPWGTLGPSSAGLGGRNLGSPAAVAADGGEGVPALAVAAAATATAALATANRVLYKLALVPLKAYPFFLAQVATFGYVIVYSSILYARHRSGTVTAEMLELPKMPFLAVGLLEALAAATGMAATAVLSGASLPVLSQTFLVWQLLLSVIFLRRKYRLHQILGCLLVTMGVIITVTSGSVGGLSIKKAEIFWSLVMIFSFFCQAADSVLKETIFLDAAKRLKGRSLDIFVVNTLGSAFQALFMALLVPVMSKLWGVPFHLLPDYIRNGAACFLNIGSVSTGCEGAPFLPILFVVVNMVFNISLLHLIKISSAVVSCLVSTFSVPLAIYAFTLPLPYVGASKLPPGFLAGAVVLMAGLLVYCLPQQQLPTRPLQPELLQKQG